jgi:predicted ribonuclease YlaK
MKKVFLLDTNVLLHDPNAMLRFEDNDVALPITVIEELDRFKKQPDMVGRNARQTSRRLDDLRQQGNLIAGTPSPQRAAASEWCCATKKPCKSCPLNWRGTRGITPSWRWPWS